jgi:Domain of unknown function (DUF4159)
MTVDRAGGTIARPRRWANPRVGLIARRLSLLSIALLACALSAQERRVAAGPRDQGEWYFTRLHYQDARGAGGRFGRGSWTTDYPEAEVHLLYGLSRLTRIATSERFIQLDLTSDEVMDYPWLYAVEVGRWYLSELEAARLREYLLRGGFLMVDDFWGTRQWDVFHQSILRVFPDRPIVEIGDNDELMTLVYDLDKSIQIPGVSYINSGVTWQQDGYTPYWRGIYDDDGRLMVAINFNMDLGDAWEHANNPRYPEPMTALAIRFAVNYAIYAMTH